MMEEAVSEEDAVSRVTSGSYVVRDPEGRTVQDRGGGGGGTCIVRDSSDSSLTNADLTASISALRDENEKLRIALEAIRDMPIKEQDNMLSANMRLVAERALL